jgi:hypothetical protein
MKLRASLLGSSMLLLAAVLAAPAGAADGVLEIDQTCVAVGCFPGDAAGYPVVITQPGSYKLTSNLDIRAQPDAANLVAIYVAAPAVTLDLAGFMVLGPAVCSGVPLACSPTGFGFGVQVHAAATGAVVRNGSITGFTAHGVGSDAAYARFEELRAWSNGHSGVVALGTGSQVVGVTAFRNAANGITVGVAGMVRRSTSNANGDHGVQGFGENLLVDATLHDNEGIGVLGNGRSVYTRSVISSNGQEGVFDQSGGSIVLGNAITANVTLGLLLNGTGSGYTENVLSANGGSVVGGLSLNQNSCNGSSC